MKLTIIIAINRFIIIVNFRNRFDKALMEIFQFRIALALVLDMIERGQTVDADSKKEISKMIICFLILPSTRKVL
jgi:hypothetical protein